MMVFGIPANFTMIYRSDQITYLREKETWTGDKAEREKTITYNEY